MNKDKKELLKLRFEKLSFNLTEVNEKFILLEDCFNNENIKIQLDEDDFYIEFKGFCFSGEQLKEIIKIIEEYLEK